MWGLGERGQVRAEAAVRAGGGGAVRCRKGESEGEGELQEGRMACPAREENSAVL